MNGRFCQLQPSCKIIPDSREQKVADRVADCLYVFARASIRMGGEVSVDVDVADGRGVKDDSPPVPCPEPVELLLVLGEGLRPEVIEELVVRVGPVDEIGEFAQFDFRDVGKERCIRTVDPGEIGVAFEDRPGEERARQGGIPSLGIFPEAFQLDARKPDRHPVAVGEPVKLKLVAKESERFERIPICLDQESRFRKSRKNFIQILVLGLLGHAVRLSHGRRSHQSLVLIFAAGKGAATKSGYMEGSGVAELFPDRGVAGLAEPDAPGIHLRSAVNVRVADHQAVDLLLVAVVVEAERVAEFVEGDFCEALSEQLFRRIVQSQRMDARRCRRQPEVGVSEEKVVAGGGNDVLFSYAKGRNFPLRASAQGLPEEDIRRNALPRGAETRSLVHGGGLNHAGNLEGVGEHPRKDPHEAIPDWPETPDGNCAFRRKNNQLPAVTASPVADPVSLPAVRASVGVFHRERLENFSSSDRDPWLIRRIFECGYRWGKAHVEESYRQTIPQTI